LTLLAGFALLVLAYGLVSGRLEGTPITAPMLFTAAGFAVAELAPRPRGGDEALSILLHVAEIGLVMLLFTDASRSDLRALTAIRNLPVRLLTTGMLLTLALGAAAALVVFPGFSIWEAGVLAAILAPTDAGLGQVIVASPKVPDRIRQALNVEAGLNDGLAVPFLMVFIALAANAGGGDGPRLSSVIVEQLGIGSLIGVGIGLGGGWLLGVAWRRKSMSPSFAQLATFTLPVLCLLASEASGASMFIAAFVAGLAVQIGFSDAGEHSVEFTEGWGQILNLLVFFVFGYLVAGTFHELTWRIWLYALLSLTIVRMLPVAAALLGAGLDRATVLFMGWFGPRGLASIVLGLIYLEHASTSGGHPTIRLAVMATVLISIVAHGASATPGIALYARYKKEDALADPSRR